jgi:hypothetical protein
MARVRRPVLQSNPDRFHHHYPALEQLELASPKLISTVTVIRINCRHTSPKDPPPLPGEGDPKG